MVDCQDKDMNNTNIDGLDGRIGDSWDPKGRTQERLIEYDDGGWMEELRHNSLLDYYYYYKTYLNRLTFQKIHSAINKGPAFTRKG